MKVKIGNKIYDSEKEPIMLILSDEDKKLISMMRPIDYKYCSYPHELGQELSKEFMKLRDEKDKNK